MLHFIALVNFLYDKLGQTITNAKFAPTLYFQNGNEMMAVSSAHMQ